MADLEEIRLRIQEENWFAISYAFLHLQSHQSYFQLLQSLRIRSVETKVSKWQRKGDTEGKNLRDGRCEIKPLKDSDVLT